MEQREEWATWEREAVKVLGEATKREREDRKLTQRALADLAGVDRGWLAKLESEDARPTELPKLGMILKLAVALRIPPIALLYPGAPDAVTVMLPGSMPVRAIEAIRWFSGESPVPGDRVPLSESRVWQLLSKSREREALLRRVERDVVTEALTADDGDAMPSGARIELSAAIDRALIEIRGLSADIRELGGITSQEIDDVFPVIEISDDQA